MNSHITIRLITNTNKKLFFKIGIESCKYRHLHNFVLNELKYKYYYDDKRCFFRIIHEENIYKYEEIDNDSIIKSDETLYFELHSEIESRINNLTLNNYKFQFVTGKDKVFIMHMTEKTMIECDLNNNTIFDLKFLIKNKFPLDQQYIYYNGKLLNDQKKTLSDIGIKSDDTIFMTVREKYNLNFDDKIYNDLNLADNSVFEIN